MSTADKPMRSVRLDDESIDSILVRLDSVESSSNDDQRDSKRYPCRIKGCVVEIHHPGSGTGTRFLVPVRNISAGGIAFLHGGFVHMDSKCIVQLISTHGAWTNVRGRVVRCRFIEGATHEVAIAFERNIDPAEYCQLAMKTRILLADDDIDVVRLAKLHLKKLNAEVDHAENGKIAVELAANNVYDLIMMDVSMPVMDGLTAVKTLRGKGYTGMIAAVTAMTRPEDKENCLNAGCDRYIAKPFTREDLAELIETLRQEPLLSSYHNDSSMSEIINEFVSGLPSKLRNIEEAYIQDKATELEHLARDIKGEAGGYGFEPITAAAKLVENAIIDKHERSVLKSKVDELVKLCILARSSAKTSAPIRDTQPTSDAEAEPTAPEKVEAS